MRVTVTGGSGFIGSHVVDKLEAAGHDIVVVDVRPPHRPGLTYREADVTDLRALVRATADCGALFHLAAVSNVNDAYADPVGTMEINVTGTARVWEAARRNGIGRAILASTVWVYASAAGDGVLTEMTPMAVTGTEHVYTASKLAAELVVTSCGELYDQPYTILRYGIPFGPRMRPALVIPRFVKAAVDGEPLTIHGDGRQVRNYVYVEDLADAHLLALGERAANQIFNLEGPAAVSIREVVDAVRMLVNPRLPVEHVPVRPGDYAGRTISPEKARQVLGWEASTSFQDGLRRYVAWFMAEGDSGTERARHA